MAFSPHTLVAFGGGLTNGTTDDEIWQCGVRICKNDGSGNPDGPLDSPAAYMGAIATPLGDWFGDDDNQMSSASDLQWLKVNNIAADGKYSSSGATNQHDYETPVAGAVASHVPSMLTLAWSWTTAIARGPGHTGRIFPPVSLPSQTSNELTSTVTGFMKAAAAALLDVIFNESGAGDTSVVPVVASRVNATNTAVTGIRVGSVIDVQRRRKNALLEVYNSTVWPTT